MKETTLCYIEKDNCYLMLHRIKKQDDVNLGKWIGIGGKLEDGETPEQCLLREAYEETGLTLTSHTFRGRIYFHSDIYGDELMYLYTADKFEGEITECDEGTLEWIEKDKLHTLSIWEGDKIFLSLIAAGAKPFDLSLEYKGEKLVSAEIDGKKIF